MDAVLKAVECDAPDGKTGAFRLNLQPCQRGAVSPVRQEQGDDAVAGPHVQSPPGLFHPDIS